MKKYVELELLALKTRLLDLVEKWHEKVKTEQVRAKALRPTAGWSSDEGIGTGDEGWAELFRIDGNIETLIGCGHDVLHAMNKTKRLK